MIKNVYIIVEGQTEQMFVNEILRPYLKNYNIKHITPILIHTSRKGRGGFVNYKHVRNTALPLLRNPKDNFIVTTFVDYFRMPHNIPCYSKAQAEPNKSRRINILENAIDKDINDSRFFAYIQLHEFEALLFSNIKGFNMYSHGIREQINRIIQEYKNPEDINSSPEGAPSKRMLSIIPRYSKVVEGNIIASEVGINDMLNKCPRFKTWVKTVITKATLPNAN